MSPFFFLISGSDIFKLYGISQLSSIDMNCNQLLNTPMSLAVASEVPTFECGSPRGRGDLSWGVSVVRLCTWRRRPRDWTEREMTSIRDVVVLKLQAQVLLCVTGVCAAYTCVVCACVCVSCGGGGILLRIWIILLGPFSRVQCHRGNQSCDQRWPDPPTSG